MTRLPEAPLPPPPRVPISGWGRFPVVEALERRGESLEVITADAALSRGLGRSYGDSSLPASADDVVANTTLADRLLAFDESTGELRAEAGLALDTMNRLLMPRGWMTPVTPGTKFVTLGGMAASDVHGKSHHVDGCFGEHVTALRLRTADGVVREVSATAEPELFRATLGGMGLTGHILEVQCRLKRLPSPWIWGEVERYPDLDALLVGLRDASREWPYTVTWADCLAPGGRLGRGILHRGRWAEPSEAPAGFPPERVKLEVPVTMPDWLLRPELMRGFNWLTYTKQGERVRRGVIHPDVFFYPLDAILRWNRMYGTRGFTQWQCVLPAPGCYDACRRLLERLRTEGGVPFLCVIKDCGPEGRGLLSFPLRGISVALDFPIRGAATQRLTDRINELVAAEGGRIYLTKDTFTRAEHFAAMEPRLPAWTAIRRRWDPAGRLRSALSVRLLGDEA